MSRRLKIALGYHGRDRLPTLVKEVPPEANGALGVPFRETWDWGGWPRPHGPWIVLVRDLRTYLKSLDRAAWRQFPTQVTYHKSRRWELEQKPKARAATKEERQEGRMCHGGLKQVLASSYNSDGYRIFTFDEVKRYSDLRHDAKVKATGKGVPGDPLRQVVRAPITADVVRRFYALWLESSGYRNRLGSLRKLIAPIKLKIARWVLGKARESYWPHGVKDRILYIDTPDGQVSFHRAEEVAEGLPAYQGDWSGLRNSDMIIRKLLGEDTSIVPELGPSAGESAAQMAAGA
jgi:hypothetical protein